MSFFVGEKAKCRPSCHNCDCQRDLIYMIADGITAKKKESSRNYFRNISRRRYLDTAQNK